MEVFIETSEGSATRKRYDEATFQIKEIFNVKTPYPYAYGFIIGSNKDQEDCVDCFVVSGDGLIEGKAIECEPVFMLEVHEGSEQDNKVIMKTPEFMIRDEDFIENTIRSFITNISSNAPDHMFTIGRKIGEEETIKFITSQMS